MRADLQFRVPPSHRNQAFSPSVFQRIANPRPPCVDVFRQPLAQSRPQMLRLFDQQIPQRAREFRKLGFANQSSTSAANSPRPGPSSTKSIRSGEPSTPPHLFELPRQQPPKHGMNVA